MPRITITAGRAQGWHRFVGEAAGWREGSLMAAEEPSVAPAEAEGEFFSRGSFLRSPRFDAGAAKHLRQLALMTAGERHPNGRSGTWTA
jgi:hypothetical protein